MKKLDLTKSLFFKIRLDLLNQQDDDDDDANNNNNNSKSNSNSINNNNNTNTKSKSDALNQRELKFCLYEMKSGEVDWNRPLAHSTSRK